MKRLVLCLVFGLSLLVAAPAFASDGNTETPGIEGNTETPGFAPEGFDWFWVDGLWFLMSR